MKKTILRTLSVAGWVVTFLAMCASCTQPKDTLSLNKSVSYVCVDSSNVLYAIGLSEDDLELTLWKAAENKVE